MGWYTRAEHETAIIATRGPNPTKLIRSRSVRSTFIAPAEKSEDGHSRKPAAIRTVLEELFHGPFVELFARREVPGWDCWGDELGRPLEVRPPAARQLTLGGGR
jgi:N6-adenosine-specific RNA methylase IME4